MKMFLFATVVSVMTVQAQASEKILLRCFPIVCADQEIALVEKDSQVVLRELTNSGRTLPDRVLSAQEQSSNRITLHSNDSTVYALSKSSEGWMILAGAKSSDLKPVGFARCQK